MWRGRRRAGLHQRRVWPTYYTSSVYVLSTLQIQERWALRAGTPPPPRPLTHLHTSSISSFQEEEKTRSVRACMHFFFLIPAMVSTHNYLPIMKLSLLFTPIQCLRNVKAVRAPTVINTSYNYSDRFMFTACLFLYMLSLQTTLTQNESSWPDCRETSLAGFISTGTI